MKKSISIALLAAVLFQCCVVYQKTPVTLSEANQMGKVRVITQSGNKMNFLNIESTMHEYFGIKKDYKVPLDPEASLIIYQEDAQKSKTRTVILKLSIILGLIGLVIYGISNMTFNMF